MPHRRFGVLRLERWFNDHIFRPWKGYSARDGTWRYVGAGALAFGLFGAAVIAGGGVASREAPARERQSRIASSRPFPGWKEPDPTTTTPQPPPQATGSRPRADVKGSAPARGGHCRSLDQIAKDESGGDYTAQNPRSTASGKYQVLDTTWAGYGGYAHAKDAPPAVQEQQAHEMYAQAGTTPWRASGC